MAKPNKISSRLNLSSGNISRFQKYKIYKFLLQEQFYTRTWDTHQKFHKNIKAQTSSEKTSFLLMKQVIRELCFQPRHQKAKIFCKNQHNQPKFSLVSEFLSEPIAVLLLSIYEQNRNENSLSVKGNLSGSVHLVLASVEKKWQYGFSIMDGNLISSIHPEIFLRILRKSIKDVCFFHLLRKIFHFHLVSIPFPIISLNFYKEKNFNTLLWNWYALEFDNFLITETSNLSKQRTKNYPINNDDDLSTFQKFSKWIPLFVSKEKKLYAEAINRKIFKKNEKVSYFLKRSFCSEYRGAQYIRFKKTWLLNNQAKKRTIETIKERCVNFWKYRLGYTSKIPNIQLVFLGNSCFFLGYFLKKKILAKIFEIRINNFLTKSLKIQSFCIYSPISLIIKILSEYNFCTSKGYPISKSEWATLTDFQIVKQFKNIRNNIISYHSGSSNRKTLLCFQHILSYSCAKTLACKHKSNLRNIWKRFGSNITVKSFSSENLFTITFNNIYVINQKTRNWNLSLKKPDFFTLALDNRLSF